VKRQVVGERVAEQDRQDRDGRGDSHRAEKNFDVERIGDELVIVLEVPLVNEEAVAHEPEAMREHQRVGKQQKQADPQKGRRGDQRLVGA